MQQLSLSIMTGPRLEILFCVLLIQRAAGQCQSDIYVSVDDLMRALGNNGNQQSISICENSREPSISFTTEQSCGRPSRQSCGCDNRKPSFPFGQQPCGIQQQPSFEINQPSIALAGKPCGFQPSISVANKPSFSNGQCSRACEIQQRPTFAFESPPSVSIVQQPYGFEIQQQPPFAIASKPSVPIGQQRGCGNQQSFSIQPALPRLQLPQQSCGGRQQSFSVNQPCFAKQQQVSEASQYFNSELEIPLKTAIVGASFDISNLGNIASGNHVPNALMQAPPFGVFFEGDNLIIDGAVQVCGSMPFRSVVEVSGRVPASGSGCIQYECDDFYECKNKN